MKDIFLWLVTSVFLVTSKGQCSLNSNDSGVIVSRCDSSVIKGRVVYVDFYKINSSCTCTVSPKFTGDIFVLLKASTAAGCNTQIKINNDFTFDCKVQAGSNHTFNVQNNQVLRVQAEYTQSSRTGLFQQCVQFSQYGDKDGDLEMQCAVSAASTTRLTTTTTLTTPLTTTTSSKTTPSKTTTSTPSKTTTTPSRTIKRSTNSRKTRYSSFIVPSEKDRPGITFNRNKDVTTNSKEMTTTGFYSSTMGRAQDDSQNVIYIIVGVGTGSLIILTGILICILAKIKREKLKRTNDRSMEEDSAPSNEISNFSNALTENRLYVSSDEVIVRYTVGDKREQDSSETNSKPKRKSNPDDGDGPSLNQSIDSMSICAVPNNGNTSHPEIGRHDLYAQVFKQNKSDAQVHGSLQTKNQDSFFCTKDEQDLTNEK